MTYISVKTFSVPLKYDFSELDDSGNCIPYFLE